MLTERVRNVMEGKRHRSVRYSLDINSGLESRLEGGGVVGDATSLFRPGSLALFVIPTTVWPTVRQRRVWWQDIASFAASLFFACEVTQAEHFAVAVFGERAVDGGLAKNHC